LNDFLSEKLSFRKTFDMMVACWRGRAWPWFRRIL